MAARPPAVPAVRAQAGQTEKGLATNPAIAAGGDGAKHCCGWPTCVLDAGIIGDAVLNATSPPMPISHSRVAVEK